MYIIITRTALEPEAINQSINPHPPTICSPTILLDILSCLPPADEHNPTLQRRQVKEEDISVLSQDPTPVRPALVRELATLPASFETINWTWDNSSSKPPIQQLLFILLLNPGLGASVEHLSFSRRYTVRNGGFAPIRPNEREMKAIQDMIHEAQFPMESVWINALELGNINVFVALLLSQLTGLETLYLDAEFFTDTKFLGLLFKHALLSNQGSARLVSDFPVLYHVRFALVKRFESQGMGRGYLMDRDQVKALFYLPAIEIIEAVVFQQRTFNWPTPSPPIASKLKILKLPLCELDENGLRRILSATPNLEILTYDRWCNSDDDESAYYDLDILGLALAKVRATLRRLSLSVCLFGWSVMIDRDEPYDKFGIGKDPWPYQKYEKLEYLEISFVILFGYNQTCTPIQRMNNLLPRLIRHLYLRDDMANYTSYEWDSRAILERLRELIAGRDRLLPHLESITLHLRNSSESQWDESEQGELKSWCAGAGITCNIDKVVFAEY